MDRQWKWRVLFVASLVVLSALMLVPTIVGTGKADSAQAPLPEWFTSIFKDKMVLGLDLQGGIHLQYKVDVEEALARKTVKTAAGVEHFMKTEKQLTVTATPHEGKTLDEITTVKVEFPTAGDTDKLDTSLLQKQLPAYEIGDVTDNVMTLVMRTSDIDQFVNDSLEKSMETLERRVNEFGVSESTISRRGETELVVQLPGVNEKDFAKAKEKLAQTGQLRFQIVDQAGGSAFFTKIATRQPKADAWPKALEGIDSNHKVYAQGNTIRSTSREILLYMAKGQFDKDHLVGISEMFAKTDDPTLSEVRLSKQEEKIKRRQKKSERLDEDVTQVYELNYLWSIHGMSGENVEDASVGYDEFNKPVVNMRFAPVDADKFFKMTKEFTKELMAIMIDDVVYSAPQIREPIGGGRVQIELGVGPTVLQEAESLVAVLKSGALQAPLRKLYDSQVGPTLGSDSVEAGKTSILVSFGFVVIFMIIYYQLAGLIANMALMLNVLFLLACLTMLGAALTLPGIAGIVLTVGMAVDANVLIFERIREELHKGMGVRKAIDAGYEKAFSAIIDANVTTGIAAAVLYQFGSGPVKGFAVTLFIGILCSMFTALYCTRLVFTFLYGRGAEPTRMSI